MSAGSAVSLSLRLTRKVLYVCKINVINIDDNVKAMYGCNSASQIINGIRAGGVLGAEEKSGTQPTSQYLTAPFTKIFRSKIFIDP